MNGISFSLKGVLDGAGFPAVVTAHFVPVEGQQRPRTTILIKFAEEVTDYLFVFHYVRSDVPILSSYSNLVAFFPLQGTTKRRKVRLMYMTRLSHFGFPCGSP